MSQGRTIAAEAGDALDSILTTVSSSSDEMRTVAAQVADLTAGARKITETAEGLASMSEQSAAGATDVAASTARVTDAIVQVSATSEETSASAEQVAASSEELAAQSEELSATAASLRDFALELNEVAASFRLFSLTDGSSAQHLQAAMEAHRQWNARLQKAVHSGTSDVSPDVAAKDNACAFGKWLYGDGRTEIGAADVHARVLALHATFHKEAAKVLTFAVSGQGAEAARAMRQGSPFAAVQCQLMVELGRAQRTSASALVRAA